tara:strand:- start:1840 stop:2271 length:432 start_codon:yes stop_codon:yes gene_type:complete
MNKSTPIHELPGNNEDEETDSNRIVDDILKELQKQPGDQLLPPPIPSGPIESSQYSLLPNKKNTQSVENPLNKKYEQFIWWVEHLKIPLLIIVFYLIFHNRSFTIQLSNVLPLYLQDNLSLSYLLLKAVILAVCVEVSYSMWE